jgi:hypothetical protein
MIKSGKRYFNFNPTRQPATGVSRPGFLSRPVGGGTNAWKDELGDVLSIQRSGAGITLNLAEATVDFDYNAAYHVTPSLADMLYKNVQLNHDRNLAVAIQPHLHWLQAKNYSPNFLFEYRWQINAGVK